MEGKWKGRTREDLSIVEEGDREGEEIRRKEEVELKWKGGMREDSGRR